MWSRSCAQTIILVCSHLRYCYIPSSFLLHIYSILSLINNLNFSCKIQSNYFAPVSKLIIRPLLIRMMGSLCFWRICELIAIQGPLQCQCSQIKGFIMMKSIQRSWCWIFLLTVFCFVWVLHKIRNLLSATKSIEVCNCTMLQRKGVKCSSCIGNHRIHSICLKVS
jgi:hypothetical protein